jgi:hypothetical protein
MNIDVRTHMKISPTEFISHLYMYVYYQDDLHVSLEGSDEAIEKALKELESIYKYIYTCIYMKIYRYRYLHVSEYLCTCINIQDDLHVSLEGSDEAIEKALKELEYTYIYKYT